MIKGFYQAEIKKPDGNLKPFKEIKISCKGNYIGTIKKKQSYIFIVTPPFLSSHLNA